MADYRNPDGSVAAQKQAVSVNPLTAAFPPQKSSKPYSQTRRSPVSIVANPAEGLGRGTDFDFDRFVRMAKRSHRGRSAQLDLAVDLGLPSGGNFRAVDLQDLQVRLTNQLQILERDGGEMHEENSGQSLIERS